jgi:hypothetical protein
MKELKKGMIVTVESKALLDYDKLAYDIKTSQAEIIGKIFNLSSRFVTIILSYKQRNLTIFNKLYCMLCLKNIDNKPAFRIAAEEEKEYWRKNNNLYSFTTDIKYSSIINFVFKPLLLNRMLISLCKLYIEVDQDKIPFELRGRIARNTKIMVLTDCIALLQGKIIKLAEKGIIDFHTVVNNHYIISNIPEPLYTCPDLFNIFRNRINEIWKSAVHDHRMYLYKSNVSKLRLK